MRKLLFVLSVGVIGAALFFASQFDALNLVEQDPPKIEFAAMPSGLGVNKRQAQLLVSDSGSGLGSVSLYMKQSEQVLELAQQKFNGETRDIRLVVDLPASPKGFSDGEVELVATTVDRSFWKNTSSVSAKLPLDLRQPRLEILSRQYIADVGGAELLLFRSDEEHAVKLGVEVGDHFYPAIPAGGISKALAPYKDVYACLFALPLEMEAGVIPEVMAEDRGGNRSKLLLPFRVRHSKHASVTPKVSHGFVREKVLPLVEGYREMSGEDVQFDSQNPDDLVKAFTLVNENYRRLILQKLAGLAERSVGPRLWSETFIKPMAASTSSTFGEQRSYRVDGQEAGGSRHDGLDLASVRLDKVLAANDGVVLFVGDLGIYGTTVVIGHGLGMISIYGHLSSIGVEEGNEVKRGNVVGRSGETGLAGGDHLHFEFRIMDTPVDPREWWDSHWIEDNITGKIDAVVERLAAVDPHAFSQASSDEADGVNSKDNRASN
jgi:murein DD-endopeptidase MepM/ murein hydrolase activator NlpD